MGRAPEGYFDLFVAKRSYGTSPAPPSSWSTGGSIISLELPEDAGVLHDLV